MRKNVAQLADSRDGVAENTRQEAQLCLEPLEGVLESFREFRRPHITGSAVGLEESFGCTSQEFDVHLTLERHLILEILSLRQPNLHHSINRSTPMISASG